MQIGKEILVGLVKKSFGVDGLAYLEQATEVRTIQIPVEQALGIYQIRFKIISNNESKKRDVFGYQNTLNELSKFNEQEILIHEIISDNFFILIFSDLNLSRVLGYISDNPINFTK